MIVMMLDVNACYGVTRPKCTEKKTHYKQRFSDLMPRVAVIFVIFLNVCRVLPFSVIFYHRIVNHYQHSGNVDS